MANTDEKADGMSEAPALRNHAAFIWSVADKLRGVYRQYEYGRVILPLVVLRRLDCVLEPTKADVLARHEALKGRVENLVPVLEHVSGIRQVYNTSRLDFRRLLDGPTNVAGNLRSYIAGFSPATRDVIEKFGFDSQPRGSSARTCSTSSSRSSRRSTCTRMPSRTS